MELFRASIMCMSKTILIEKYKYDKNASPTAPIHESFYKKPSFCLSLAFLNFPEIEPESSIKIFVTFAEIN